MNRLDRVCTASWGLIVFGVDILKCTSKTFHSLSFSKQELPEKLVEPKGPQRQQSS